jgi:hypothetical protein
MDEIRDLLDQIEARFAELRNAVNDVLNRVPGWAAWIGDRIREGWDYMCVQAEKFWNWLSGILSNMGDPGKLSSTASSWNSSVGGPVSAQVQVAEAGNLEADDNWSGTASDRYRARISLHKTALDKVKSSMTDGLSSALDTVKTAILFFWGALAIALAVLVGGLITAIASEASVFCAPAGPFIAAAAILGCLTSMTAGGYKLKSDCRTARNTLEQKVIDESSAFLGGHWPAGAAS